MEKVVSTLIVLFFATCQFIFAQENVPPLERQISIELKGNSSKEALEFIEVSAALNFGYRTDLVPDANRLERSYTNKTVRQILDDLFQGTLVYKEKGNYIILKKAELPKETEIVLEGYVFNAQTGDRISYVSIFDSLSLESALTDVYGHYSLTLQKKDTVYLKASKYAYFDTLIPIIAGQSGLQNVYLTPKFDSLSTVRDSSRFQREFPNWRFPKLSEEQKATIENFKENFKRKAQFSVLPMVGTNGALSPSTDVDYSFNLIGGLNGGVNVVEVGGIFNADWDTVRYVQVAGITNIVGGPQYGAQVAGVVNLNGSSFDGAQVAGVLNFTQGPVYGFQGAGIGNATFGPIDGVQVGGVANYAGSESNTVQVSGVANYIHTNSAGTQISGVANAASNDFRGVQIAGVCNYAEDGFKGSQISGLVNVAGRMTGTQLSVFNFNDSIDGVPIGFFSYSRKGLHQLELSANELTHLNVAFKSGTNQFYNSFIASTRFEPNRTPTWGFGYGIGASVRAGKRNRLFFDAQSVNHFRDNGFGLALNNKLTISYQFQLAKKVGLAIGPSANLFIIDLGDQHDIGYFQNMAPYVLTDQVTNGGLQFQSWIGGHVALRLF